MSINGWQSRTIGELLASSLPGDWGTESNPEQGVPILRSTNFQDDGSIDYSDIAFRYVAKARLERRRIGIGTILIEKAGGSSIRPAGRVVYCDREFNGTASNFVEVVHVKEEYSPKFVFYRLYFNFQTGLVNKYQQQTTGIINFKLREYFDEVIEIPNAKPEQSKIAELLTTVDQAIERTEALIAKQQRIKTGLMQDLLTRGIDEHGNLRFEQTHEFKDSPLGRIPVSWEVRPIEHKLEWIIDYRGRTPKKVEAGIPLLTAKNVREGYLDEDPHEFIAEDAYDTWMTRGIPSPGDVLFTTEAPMGNVARVPHYRIALAQRLLTLCPKRLELSQDYLFWMLHWSRTKERLELLTSGSTVVGVKQSVFRKVLFRFPEPKEQGIVTRILNAHDESCASHSRQLEKLCSIKTALMQDFLTGERRVTALVAEPVVGSQ